MLKIEAIESINSTTFRVNSEIRLRINISTMNLLSVEDVSWLVSEIHYHETVCGNDF